MNPMTSNHTDRRGSNFLPWPVRPLVLLLPLIWCWLAVANGRLAAAELATNSSTAAGDGVEGNSTSVFNVVGFQAGGSPTLATNVLIPLLAGHTGTNVSLSELVKAAADLHEEYRRQGYPMMSVAIPLEKITNGIVPLNAFQTAVPQVVVSGRSWMKFTNETEVTIPKMVAQRPQNENGELKVEDGKNRAAQNPSSLPAGPPATPEQIAQAQAALLAKMADIDAHGVDHRIHVVSTNSGPRFAVDKYLVMGNSALPPLAFSEVLTNIDGAFGTNVSFEGIHTVVEELQKAYRERGYVTVVVGLPQQKLTNATVKVQVVEGRLAVINVIGNHYFSSNNVMRALPSLHTNMLLNGPVFQAELNRANASRDRQIYPVIGPGPEPGSSALTLKVKDQLPLHGKLEFNNESTPGTPDLRVNGSAETDNLWQLEHAFGIQYGFSPESYKNGHQWDFYDMPAVANYSAFYRMPLGNPQPVDQLIANSHNSFGYNEATHRLNLPPVTGGPSLTLFGSRSTIDNGVTTLSSANLYNTNGNRLDLDTVQEDSTINSDIGFRINAPLQTSDNFHSAFSFGPDYKHYELNSGQTNIFTLTSSEILYNPPRTNTVVSKNYSPVPYTVNQLDYLPLTLSYNAGWQDSLGAATFGLDAGVNLWYSSQTSFTASDTNGTPVTAYLNGSQSLQYISGSKESSGHWVVVRPAFSQQIVIHTDWIATFRADGQWASEPLISNEQFGVGGVNSVRGYYEGEAFGDTGWHVSLEQQTPSHQIGMVNGNVPLTVRGLAYMDYATAYLLDAQGRAALRNEVQLWSVGTGIAAAISPHWQSQFLISLPLIGTTLTPRDEPRFNFVLTAQF